MIFVSKLSLKETLRVTYRRSHFQMLPLAIKFQHKFQRGQSTSKSLGEGLGKSQNKDDEVEVMEPFQVSLA